MNPAARGPGMRHTFSTVRSAALGAALVAFLHICPADTTGSIVAGKAADIVAMGSNPLDEIEAVLNLQFIMRDGVVFRQESIEPR
jgi:imidazolonepropionase-like amidohydrolase